MKKIRLDPESLDVLSFATDAAAAAPRGTVLGRAPFAALGEEAEHKYEWTAWPSCASDCAFQTHEFESCDGGAESCGPSCDWPCGSEGGVGVVDGGVRLA